MSVLLQRIAHLERRVQRLRVSLNEARHSRDLWKARALRRGARHG